jgi:general secretion pathway protein A
MYLEYFGLSEKPFSITPDPRYLYLSARHEEALAHLAYGITEAGGFIQLTGEVGTGKTTTIRTLLARAPKNAEIALIINPRMSPVEFVQTICEELGLGLPDVAEGNLKELIDVLNRYLLRMHAGGRRVVLIVDEAQNLTPDVLEQVRLLTNLETSSQKLLQIILIGQPELRALLDRNDLRQLAQRVTARFHLDPLAEEETAGYVRHRLRVAGTTSEIFPVAALREVHRVAGGIPRVINIVCDRALLAAYTSERHQVSTRLVRESASEVFGRRLAPRWLTPLATALALLTLTGGALVLWKYAPWSADTRDSTSANTAARANNSSAGDAARAGISLAGSAPASDIQPLAMLLAQPADQSSVNTALGNLLRLWQGSYLDGDRDACAQAQQQGLECVSLRSSLAQLRELNRPAVLMLSDAERRTHQVVLTAMHNDAARLLIGGRSARVAIADLSAWWFGDLVLMWRPTAPTVNSLTVGARGPAVRELRNRLMRWRGAVAVSSSMEFDAELARMVEEFQKAHHLTADGIAGLDTQLLLDSELAAPGSPLLQPPTEQR